MKQYEIYLVNLDPTVGSEIQKTRPCVIISPDEMNQYLRIIQIAPMTTTTKKYPWRVRIIFKRKKRAIAFDQIRTIDKQRLIKKVGTLKTNDVNKLKKVLNEMLIM